MWAACSRLERFAATLAPTMCSENERGALVFGEAERGALVLGEWKRSVKEGWRSCLSAALCTSPQCRKLHCSSPWPHSDMSEPSSWFWPGFSPLPVLLVQFSSVAQSCLTLCNPVNRSTPGLPVHHQLPEPTQTHVHWVSDAIQPFHPLSSPSPPSPNPSQH